MPEPRRLPRLSGKTLWLPNERNRFMKPSADGNAAPPVRSFLKPWKPKHAPRCKLQSESSVVPTIRTRGPSQFAMRPKLPSGPKADLHPRRLPEAGPSHPVSCTDLGIYIGKLGPLRRPSGTTINRCFNRGGADSESHSIIRHGIRLSAGSANARSFVLV